MEPWTSYWGIIVQRDFDFITCHDNNRPKVEKAIKCLTACMQSCIFRNCSCRK